MKISLFLYFCGKKHNPTIMNFCVFKIILLIILTLSIKDINKYMKNLCISFKQGTIFIIFVLFFLWISSKI